MITAMIGNDGGGGGSDTDGVLCALSHPAMEDIFRSDRWLTPVMVPPNVYLKMVVESVSLVSLLNTVVAQNIVCLVALHPAGS